MFVVGMDAGGTKTHCRISNELGTIIGEGYGGKANYQTCGVTVAEASMLEALDQALARAGIGKEQISYGVLGLAGADQTRDIEILEPICKKVMGSIPFELMNDTWIGLRSGSEYGIVSICGTGAAHAGINRDGRKVIFRNIDYLTGNRGGGAEVVEKAIHYAFRSNEGTYHGTAIEADLPDLFKVSTMNEVVDVIRDRGVPDNVAYEIPKLVLELAEEGDYVAGMIIEDMAKTEGQYGAELIRRLGMDACAVPCVMIGSMFATQHPLLIQPYMNEIKKAANAAYPVYPEQPPVNGAVLLAIDYLKIR